MIIGAVVGTCAATSGPSGPQIAALAAPRITVAAVEGYTANEGVESAILVEFDEADVDTADTADSVGRTVVSTGLETEIDGVWTAMTLAAGVYSVAIAGAGDRLKAADATTYRIRRTATIDGGAPVTSVGAGVAFAVTLITASLTPSDTTIADGDPETFTIAVSLSATITEARVYDQDDVLVATIVAAAWETTAADLIPGTHVHRVEVETVESGARVIEATAATVTVSAVAPTLTAPANGGTIAEGETAEPLSATAGASTTAVRWLAAINGGAYAEIGSDAVAAGGWTAEADFSALNLGDSVAIKAEATHPLAQGGTATIESAVSTLTVAAATLAFRRDLLFASATWTTPATFYGLDETPNQAKIGLIGTGGGGTLGVGAGGGGEYSESTLTLTPSTGYAVVLPAGAIDTDGGDATFATTTIVAKGGKSGTNGGAGGTGGTGTTKRDGGAGIAGSGNTTPGAASGSVSAASLGVPGQVEPSLSVTAAAGALFGGGGGSSAAAGFAGEVGLFAAEYLVPASAGYPTLIGVSRSRDTANAVTRNITIPPGEVGDLIVVAVAASSATPTLAITDFTATTLRASTFSAAQYLYKVATGTDAVALTSASCMLNWEVRRYRNAGAPVENGAGSSTQNPDPEAVTFGAAGAHVVISLVGIRGNNPLLVTDDPTGYGNTWVSGRSVSGCPYLLVADKEVTGSSEDPGAWATSAANNNCRSTLAIPYSA